MKIEIEKLKMATEKLFKYLEDLNIKEIDFENDYYWVISEEQQFETSKDPSNFTIGQLTDDYQEVLKDINEEVSGHTFYHLAPLLKYLSQKII